ncbi:sulfotransferase 4A1-like [Venturia canescens]|uniref:sulfotransferase 4A1-like n=1 Tax=Venturia canescens TaxID=32260 RepID=UPI001C9C8634|nr:sulfotransferase 4A1-like [Venturia canescens]
MDLKLPKYEVLEESLTKKMLEKFKGERTGWVKVGEKGYFFPHRYVEQGEGFYKFKARSSDTWVLSYPRSGTTWTQELVWLISNNLDFDTANKRYLSERFPFLEFSMFNHPEVTQEFVKLNEGDKEKKKLCKEISKPGYEVLENLLSPRFIKSHFPLSLLPGILDTGCKIIYVARNPKDVAVSWYHLNRAISTQGYEGNFEEFWNYFRNDLTPWSPYWEHLKEAWAQRHHPNLLFLFYEDLQMDFRGAIESVSKFLGKSYNAEEISQLMNHLDIKNFRHNPMVNSSELRACGIITPGNFVRNGKSGGWKETFTDTLEASADTWIEENLKDTDLRFPHFSANNNNEIILTDSICHVGKTINCKQ